MLSESPENTDIDSEQVQQKSASILNVLRAPMPADISMDHTNVFDYSCFDSYNGESLKHFWCKNEACIIGQNSSIITIMFEHKCIA